jgi:hypothetical protein
LVIISSFLSLNLLHPQLISPLLFRERPALERTFGELQGQFVELLERGIVRLGRAGKKSS